MGESMVYKCKKYLLEIKDDLTLFSVLWFVYNVPIIFIILHLYFDDSFDNVKGQIAITILLSIFLFIFNARPVYILTDYLLSKRKK